jgi:hypothetical protein
MEEAEAKKERGGNMRGNMGGRNEIYKIDLLIGGARQSNFFAAAPCNNCCLDRISNL